MTGRRGAWVLAVAAVAAGAAVADDAPPPVPRPDLAGQLLASGRTLLARRDFDAAGAAFTKALQYDPKCILAHYELARARQGAGRTVEAVAAYRTFTKLAAEKAKPTPEEAAARADAEKALLRLCAHLRQWRELRRRYAGHFRALAAERRGLPSTVRALEVAAVLAGDDAGIAAELAAARKLAAAAVPPVDARRDPERAKALLERAEALTKAGDADAAVEALRKACGLSGEAGVAAALADAFAAARRPNDAALAAAEALRRQEAGGGAPDGALAARMQELLRRTDPNWARVASLLKALTARAESLARAAERAGDFETIGGIWTVMAALTGAAGPAGEGYGPGDWVDVLKLIDPARDLLDGRAERADGVLALAESSYARVLAPLAIAGSYAMRVEFRFEEANGGAVLILPVGRTNAQLTLGKDARLHLVKGAPERRGGSRCRVGLAPGRPHSAHVRVEPVGRAARITVAVNGRVRLQWRGPQAALDNGRRSYAVPDWRCCALGAYHPPLTYRAAQLKLLAGKASLIRRTAGGRSVERVPGGALPAGQWLDVTGIIDPAADCFAGAWKRVEGGLASLPVKSGRSVLLLPVAPNGGYRLSAVFTVAAGANGPTLLLPAGEGSVAMVLSGYNDRDLNALREVGGRTLDCGNAPAVADKARHTAEIAVVLDGEEAHVTCTVDGKACIDWRGRQTELSGPDHFRAWLGRRPGIAAGSASLAAFHSIRFRPLAEGAVRLR